MAFVTLCVGGISLMLVSTILTILARPIQFQNHVVHPRASARLVYTLVTLMILSSMVSDRTVSVVMLMIVLAILSAMLKPIAPIVAVYVGAFSNCAVVLANGGRMPVIVRGFDGPRHFSGGPTTRLSILSDVFPVMSGAEITGAFSIGDVFICVGFWWFFARMITLCRTPA